MPITFKYVNVQRKDGTLRKAPFIPVYVRTKEGKLMRLVALLDSGADTTVVPKDLAIVLGLKERRMESETGGIGGKVKVKDSRMSFRVKGEHESHSLDIPVLVLQDPDADVPLLLGRSGFFEHFNINFRQNVEKITLKKVEPNH